MCVGVHKRKQAYLWEDKLFRGGGIGVLPTLLGATEGSLMGAFFGRGGTIRSFEEEIRVSSCRLCELYGEGLHRHA